MPNRWRIWQRAVLAVVFLAAAIPAIHAQEIPAGTSIAVTLNDSVSSKDARTGQRVSGSVTAAVVVGDKVVIPRGAHVRLSVASVQESGRLSTPAKLWLKIDSIEAHGKTYDVSTHWSGQTGESHAKRDAVGVGGGSVLGAVLGGIAGGGKGAVIGAAAGAGAGTAGAAATGKKDITFPAETRLRFTTKTPVKVR